MYCGFRFQAGHLVRLQPNDYGFFHEGCCYLVFRVSRCVTSFSLAIYTILIKAYHLDTHVDLDYFYTSTKSWRGYIFIADCLSVSEHNSYWANAQILMRFLLIGCLPHWLRPFWNCWPLSLGQISNLSFLHISLLTFLLWNSALRSPIKVKFSMSLSICLW